MGPVPDLNRRLLERCGYQPGFVAILPLSGDMAELRRAAITIDSLRAQVYPNWRLLVVPRASQRR